MGESLRELGIIELGCDAASRRLCTRLGVGVGLGFGLGFGFGFGSRLRLRVGG